MRKLTKYEKETIVLFNEDESTASIYTYNNKLKKKLAKFSEEHPELCKLESIKEDGARQYQVQKRRLSISFRAPLSEERKERMREWAKEHGFKKGSEK